MNQSYLQIFPTHWQPRNFAHSCSPNPTYISTTQFNDRQHHILSFIKFFPIAHISNRFYLYGTVMPDIILCYVCCVIVYSVFCVSGNRLSVPLGTLIYWQPFYALHVYLSCIYNRYGRCCEYVLSDGLKRKIAQCRSISGWR